MWNNVDEPPPRLRCTRKLLVKRQRRNTLVNRYREWPHIATRAVLLSDDDLTMCEEGVNAMLRVWSEYPRHAEKAKGRWAAATPGLWWLIWLTMVEAWGCAVGPSLPH